MHFNELSEDVIFDIFNWITSTELLASERVDKRWQRMVQETLERRVKTVVMKLLDEYNRHDFDWSVCNHLSDSRQMMSLKKMLDYVTKLKISKFNADNSEDIEINLLGGLRTPEELKLFTSLLSKLGGVRSIDFTDEENSFQALVQAFELCPELECVAIDVEELDEKDLTDCIKTFGHRLVHFSAFNIYNSEQLFRLLSQFSNNLPFLERISFEFNVLTDAIVTDIKQLQQLKNIFVMVKIKRMNATSSLDFIDGMIVESFTWNALPDNCQRLFLLSFQTINFVEDNLNQLKPVAFSGLKKLAVERANEFVLRVLIRCRFPILEELRLKFKHEVVTDLDQLLMQLFEKTPMLVKIDIQDGGLIQNQVPGLSILKLIRLKKIVWSVWIKQNWSMQVMAALFDVIGQVPSLKKLTLKYRIKSDIVNQWLAFIEQQLNRLKEQRKDLAVESGFRRGPGVCNPS